MISPLPLKTTTENLSIIEQYLEGKPIIEIAANNNKTPEEITEILNSKSVTNFITTYLKNYSYLNPIKRVNLIEQLIEKKVEEGLTTKKDITKLIELLQNEYKLHDKKETETTVNNYVAIINELLSE